MVGEVKPGSVSDSGIVVEEVLIDSIFSSGVVCF